MITPRLRSAVFVATEAPASPCMVPAAPVEAFSDCPVRRHALYSGFQPAEGPPLSSSDHHLDPYLPNVLYHLSSLTEPSPPLAAKTCGDPALSSAPARGPSQFPAGFKLLSAGYRPHGHKMSFFIFSLRFSLTGTSWESRFSKCILMVKEGRSSL